MRLKLLGRFGFWNCEDNREILQLAIFRSERGSCWFSSWDTLAVGVVFILLLNIAHLMYTLVYSKASCSVIQLYSDAIPTDISDTVHATRRSLRGLLCFHPWFCEIQGPRARYKKRDKDNPTFILLSFRLFSFLYARCSIIWNTYTLSTPKDIQPLGLYSTRMQISATLDFSRWLPSLRSHVYKATFNGLKFPFIPLRPFHPSNFAIL